MSVGRVPHQGTRPILLFSPIAYSLNLYLKVRIFDTLRTFYSLGCTKIVPPPLFMKEL